MEATVLSVGKSVLDGALSYAKSAIAEEVALQLGVQRDQAFVRDELEMMQSFLLAAHDERDDDRVVKIWVKQVRDVAYDVEDCLQDFAIRLEKQSWWHIPRTLLERRRVAKQMKELRAKVEDVSQRNVRYRLIKGSGSEPTTAAGKSSITGAMMFGDDQTRRQMDKAKVDLVGLINRKDEGLRVIAVWGTSVHLGERSVVKRAYDDIKIRKKFECRAWVGLMHPFNPTEFLRCIVRQLYVNSLQKAIQATPGAQDLRRMGTMKEVDLADAFKRYVNDKSYLIVLNDLSSIEEWNLIKTCFPTNRKGSRILVSTQQVEVASLCVGSDAVAPEHKQLSADHTLFVFYQNGSQDGTDSTEPESSPTATATCSNISGEGKSLTRIETMVAALEESELIGRVKEKSEIVKLILKEGQRREVISVWGMGGLGKTTLVKDVYHSQEINGIFEMRASVTVMRPFNIEELLTCLVMQLGSKTTGNKEVIGLMGSKTKHGDQPSLADLLEGKKYLIILDDVLSTIEWDAIVSHFPTTETASRIIVTTRLESIANHCSGDQENIYSLIHLGDKDAKDLFTKKESKLIGRVDEKNKTTELISKDSQQLEVIFVWGIGGLGKTTLVRDVYHNQEFGSTFEKRACVTVMRPFNLEELRMSLVMQLGSKTPGNKEPTGLMGGKTKQGDQQLLSDLLEVKKYLIVLDDVSSKQEWDEIRSHFPRMETASRIIVTTRVESIAQYCLGKQVNIYKLNHLGDKDVKDLFTKKVFKETIDLDDQYPDLAEEAKPILNKCSGLPLAIVTIGGFLANQPKSVVEWRNLNEHISAELETNPELGTIKTVLEKSYNGLPYHLKSCFLYMSIFPEDQKVSRRRLVRRWTAEGYSREILDKSAVEIADNYFIELMDRSMILPAQKFIHSRKGIDACQVHDLMRDIGILKSKEENLVFRLDEGCNLNTQGTIRHLAITSSCWEGDKSEFESIVDMSRIRSLTMFGKWRPFFISDKMRLLRVLDLEDAEEIFDHHLEHIWKLLHLRYLSLRGCGRIYHLPDSLGNLRQLETLDVRDTHIIKLPKSVIKLQKLNYLRAGNRPADEDVSCEEIAEDAPKLMRNRLCLLTLGSVVLCAYCSAAPVFYLHGISRYDICAMCCCVFLPAIAMRLDINGVAVPRGMRKLKALHTLGVVNVAREKAVLQEIKSLTRLRKLGVTGINKKNGQEFCAVLAALSRLESLSVRSEGEPGLSGCLDGVSSLPKNLQSLKLYGNLVKLPEWIQGLKNLVKLKLRSTRLSEHDVDMQVLGNLPSLADLGLWWDSFQGKELRFSNEGFRSLVKLDLALKDIESVKFDQGAMPILDLLHVSSCVRENEIDFSGLEFLPSIKEVRLNVSFAWNIDRGEVHRSKNRDERLHEAVKEAELKRDKLNNYVRDLLAKNQKQPILKVD